MLAHGDKNGAGNAKISFLKIQNITALDVFICVCVHVQMGVSDGLNVFAVSRGLQFAEIVAPFPRDNAW